MLYTIKWPLLYAITHPLGGPIGTTSFMVKWYEVGILGNVQKYWKHVILLSKYGTMNLSILLVNKWNNQRRLDQTNGRTSFMVKWYEVEITTMCFISWEACTNTENKLFCFQNIGPNISWSKNKNTTAWTSPLFNYYVFFCLQTNIVGHILH